MGKNREFKIGGVSGKEIDAMPSVFISVPNMGTIQTDLVLRIIAWVYGTKCIFFPPQGYSPVSVARNKCVEEFLRQDYDYLFFVDADTVPPPDAIQKLLAADKKIISGVTCNLKLCEDGLLRPAPMVMRYADPKNPDEGLVPIVKPSGVEEVDGFGMSCCMIHKSAFEGMEEPWFTEKFVAAKGEKAMGEDLIFCRKLKEKGIPLFADFSVNCDHHKMTKITYPNQLEVVRHDTMGNEIRDPKIE
jgi:glycosyltransferase involved in cell wall biosynthesis